MLTELGRRMDEHRENFNRENTQKTQRELKTIITEIKIH